MSDIPFPVEQKNALTVRDTQYLTVFATAAIQALAKTGRSSAVIWEGEPPELPYKTENWELSEVKDEFRLPIEVQRRINIVRNNNIPIKQILIAHELPPDEETPILATPKHSVRDRPRILLGLGLITAGVVLLPGVAAVIGAMIVAAAKIVGSILVCLVAFLAWQNGLDPAVVVILDDGYDSWLLAGYWYE